MSKVNQPRVGVFICNCGNKIARSLDTEALRQQTSELPEVVYTICDDYPCSKDGQERIQTAIRRQKLDRVLVAGCTPRLIEKLFKSAVQPAGMDPSYLQIVDIREHVAYIHGDQPEEALQQAADLVDMGVARLASISPAPPHSGRVVKTALVVGSGLSALTVALTLAENHMQVILVETSARLGGEAMDMQERTRQLTEERSQAVQKHPMIDTLLNSRILEVTGHPGDYIVKIQRGELTTSYSVGSIIVSNPAQSKPLSKDYWYDRNRVKTQVEFSAELASASQANQALPFNDIVMVLCAEPSQRERCTRVCCNIAVRQAIQAKQLNPQANITILFRDLYISSLAETGESDLIEARKLGITFFRYRKETPPEIGEQFIDVLDTLTGIPVKLPYDRVILTMPMVPTENTGSLSSLLGLPQDEAGFLAEPRVRLRPGRYADPGIYVLGSAQQPADTAEALFQAYLTSSRALRFLSQGNLKVESTVAKIDPALCTGCGNCTRVCPTFAIKLEKRDGVLSLSAIDDMRCIGCGNCVVVCPAKAISLPGWDNIEIPAQISAALKPDSLEGGRSKPGIPKVLVLACEWSAYAAADMAGTRRLRYPANVRIIRMNCSARFDPFHILWAFLNGANGVFLGACPPGECHYGTGNLYAKERVEVLKKELRQHGVDPNCLHLEYLSVEDGAKFAKTLTDFVEEINSSAMVHLPQSS